MIYKIIIAFAIASQFLSAQDCKIAYDNTDRFTKKRTVITEGVKFYNYYDGATFSLMRIDSSFYLHLNLSLNEAICFGDSIVLTFVDKKDSLVYLLSDRLDGTNCTDLKSIYLPYGNSIYSNEIIITFPLSPIHRKQLTGYIVDGLMIQGNNGIKKFETLAGPLKRNKIASFFENAFSCIGFR